MVALTIPTALQAGDPDDGDEGRQKRGAMIALRTRIQKTPVGYKVKSQSGSGNHFVQVGDTPYCSCPDFELRGEPCKHVYAVEYTILQGESQQGSFDLSESDSVQTPKEKKQDKKDKKGEGEKSYWTTYDEAQTHEGEDFLVLLRDLVDTVEQPEHVNGRPRLPLSDMIFGMAVKVYSTMSGRRAMTDVRNATAQGMIDKTPCYSTLYRYMEDPALTPILKGLIERSALPLAHLETHFSPDSSGFSSKSYIRWYDKKWGKEMREPRWVKAHIMSGALTNIITAAEVTSNMSNDSPYLEPFVNITAQGFDVQEVSADKAYLSRKNLRAIEAVGATPYIPFKVNSVARVANHGRDPVWERAYYYFHLNRKDFLDHYHLRSNVESTFSIVKRKFGAFVRSKSPEAQVNECLVKFLCHNLCVLIHAIYAQGVRVEFFDSPVGEVEKPKAQMELVGF